MRIRQSAALSLLAAAAASAAAEDKCLAKGKMQEHAFELKSCAVAMYDNKGVTLWFTEKPLPAATVDTFHLSSYADLAGTAMSIGFCPGGSKGVVDMKAVGSVEVVVEHAASPMVMQSFLWNPNKDKDLKFSKLSGELKPGGRLAGKMTMNTKLDRGQPYSIEAEFDVTLPAKAAAAGPGCGD